MFLKSIEIKGFKSFADKTELVFKKGITAVVGPNGSGKSNITDAVRWVLGEQSVKTLRGGKMEDVIFAGTAFRKPVGLAQVSLTLDNKDGSLPLEYNDVTITRRLYRSGESEYYINSTQCRLRDIHELFMDTGIGKEGYSMIGQGKIEAILSGKPEERRDLLEEAAGIVKYKSRKDEAVKKLNATDQNLIRINDILTTYEERLEPLRIESEKASEFIKLSEELKFNKINLTLTSHENLQKVLSEYQVKLEEVTKVVSNFQYRRDKLKEQQKTLQDKLEVLEKSNEEEKLKYYEVKSTRDSYISEIDILQSKIENQNVLINKNENEIKLIQKAISNLDLIKLQVAEEIINIKNKLQISQQAIVEDDKILKEITNDILEKQSFINDFRKKELQDIQKINDLQNKSSNLQKEDIDIKNNIEELNLSYENFNNLIKINERTEDDIKNEIDKVNTDVENKKMDLAKNKRELTHNRTILANLEKEIRTINNSFNEKKIMYNTLLNLERQNEGYNRTVKILLKNISEGKVKVDASNFFLLGDVIKVPVEFEKAINVSIGGAISDVITDSDDTAKKLINYLRESKIGRATFLPLNILSSRKLIINDAVKKVDGYIGVASELVKYDTYFEKAINYVIGRIVIAKDMDSALKIAKLMNYSTRIVTLTGEVVNAGGSLTGGSENARTTNVITRKREIEECKVAIAKLQVVLKEKEIEFKNQQELIKQLDELVVSINESIHLKQIDLTKLISKVEELDKDTARIANDIIKIKQTISLENDKLTKNKNVLENIETELEVAVGFDEERKNNVLSMEKELETKKDILEEKRTKHMELKLEAVKLQELLSTKNSEIKRIENEFINNDDKKLVYLNEIDNLKEVIKSYENKIVYNKDSISESESILEEFKVLFEQNEVLKIKLKEEINTSNSELESLLLELSKSENEKHKLEITTTKYILEIDTLNVKLKEEFDLTYEEALNFKDENINLETLKSTVKSLTQKISAIGVVNVSSIEEYRDVKEKYTFMNTQREDLLNAKLELETVIDEMTTKMRKVFKENFEIMRKYFNETFKELFKGGSADLILDGDDELTSNIIINVQPPGKKLQNINLMSGGEKVLSAIALMFAILKMKPTPFCILDEIEAALDDVNVFRYAEFLKQFSDNIQFIVVTHRKGTMESANILYGVTMEERGISKVLSVTLNDA